MVWYVTRVLIPHCMTGARGVAAEETLRITMICSEMEAAAVEGRTGIPRGQHPQIALSEKHVVQISQNYR